LRDKNAQAFSDQRRVEIRAPGVGPAWQPAAGIGVDLDVQNGSRRDTCSEPRAIRYTRLANEYGMLAPRSLTEIMVRE
jgi:hypothetical protein